MSITATETKPRALLKQARKRLCTGTIADAASLFGIGKSTIVAWEAGKYGENFNSREALRAYCRALAEEAERQGLAIDCSAETLCPDVFSVAGAA